MKKTIREIVILFILILLTNLILEIGEEEKRYLEEPFKYFSTTLVISIIGGYLIRKVYKTMDTNTEK